MQMQTETFIIMIVGLLAIGLIRLVIAMVGREYAADHPRTESKPATPAEGDSTGEVGAALPAPSQRPVRGTGRKSHLLYFPRTDDRTDDRADDRADDRGGAAAEPAADSESALPSAS